MEPAFVSGINILEQGRPRFAALKCIRAACRRNRLLLEFAHGVPCAAERAFSVPFRRLSYPQSPHRKTVFCFILSSYSRSGCGNIRITCGSKLFVIGFVREPRLFGRIGQKAAFDDNRRAGEDPHEVDGAFSLLCLSAVFRVAAGDERSWSASASGFPNALFARKTPVRRGTADR